MNKLYKADLDKRHDSIAARRKELVKARKMLSEQIKDLDSELDFYRLSKYVYNEASKAKDNYDDVPF